MEITACERASLGVSSRQEMKAVGDRLRRAREALRLTQTEFARRAGLTQNRYNPYEKGTKMLTLEAAMQLCEAYGFTLDWLFRDDAAMMPHALAEVLRRENHPDP